MAKNKTTKGHIMFFKILHRKLKIEQGEPHQELGMNTCALEGSAILAPCVTPVMLLLNGTNII